MLKIKYIVASDFHLGHQDNQKKTDDCLKLFSLVKESNTKLIILGDFIDLWRRQNADIITYNKQSLGQLPSDTIIVKGNHDISLSYPLSFEDDYFYMCHGHEFDVIANLEGLGMRGYYKWSDRLCKSGNGIGNLISMAWNLGGYITDLITIRKGETDIDRIKSFIESGSSYLLTGIPKDKLIIYGHTHSPYLGKYSYNCGSICDNRSYLKIYEDNTVELCYL